jgi:hypothetical protein
MTAELRICRASAPLAFFFSSLEGKLPASQSILVILGTIKESPEFPQILIESERERTSPDPTKKTAALTHKLRVETRSSSP